MTIDCVNKDEMVEICSFYDTHAPGLVKFSSVFDLTAKAFLAPCIRGNMPGRQIFIPKDKLDTAFAKGIFKTCQMYLEMEDFQTNLEGKLTRISNLLDESAFNSGLIEKDVIYCSQHSTAKLEKVIPGFELPGYSCVTQYYRNQLFDNHINLNVYLDAVLAAIKSDRPAISEVKFSFNRPPDLPDNILMNNISVIDYWLYGEGVVVNDYYSLKDRQIKCPSLEYLASNFSFCGISSANFFKTYSPHSAEKWNVISVSGVKIADIEFVEIEEKSDLTVF